VPARSPSHGPAAAPVHAGGGGAPAGAAALRAVWADALARGLEAPFGAAAALRQAYLSDGLNAVADRGVTLGAVLVDGGWREIDTEQDLARAELVVDDWRA